MTNSFISHLPFVVSPVELAEARDSDPSVAILDVRTPAEFETVHIPGSYNVPLDVLPEHADDLAACVGSPVVLVCRSGTRARQAEPTLRASDMPRLHVLDGGLAAWEAADLPLNRGRQRWSMERQVRGAAGGLVLAGALVGLVLWRPLGAVAAGVGGGLLVSAVTDTCGMAPLLAKLPYNRGATCDVGTVLRALRQTRETSAPMAAD